MRSLYNKAIRAIYNYVLGTFRAVDYFRCKKTMQKYFCLVLTKVMYASANICGTPIDYYLDTSAYFIIGLYA